MKTALLPVFVAASMTLSPSLLASESQLADAISKCAEINDDTKRLTCFDALSRKTAAVNKPTELVQQKQEDAFGAEAIRAREKSFARARGEEDNTPKEMTFTVLEAGKNRAGNYFFIMENGQVWRQLKADSGKFRVPKKVSGMKVKIKRKLFGSHLLTLRGNSIKVKRLK